MILIVCCDFVWFGMLLEQLYNRNVVILVKYITLCWALSGVLANQSSISKLPFEHLPLNPG